MIVNGRAEGGVKSPVKEIPTDSLAESDMATLGISRDVSDADVDDNAHWMSHNANAVRERTARWKEMKEPSWRHAVGPLFAS
jgi:hypothetical protein